MCPFGVDTRGRPRIPPAVTKSDPVSHAVLLVHPHSSDVRQFSVVAPNPRILVFEFVGIQRSISLCDISCLFSVL